MSERGLIREIGKSVNGRIKGRALSVIFHQEEVVWGTTFDLLLAHGVPLIRLVLVEARVVLLSNMLQLVRDMSAGIRLEGSAGLLRLLSLH